MLQDTTVEDQLSYSTTTGFARGLVYQFGVIASNYITSSELSDPFEMAIPVSTPTDLTAVVLDEDFQVEI